MQNESFLMSNKFAIFFSIKLFAERQEGVRKDVERAFGVLQSRFKIVRDPARLWYTPDLKNVMDACLILHNMIVEDQKVDYNEDGLDLDIDEDAEEFSLEWIEEEFRNESDNESSVDENESSDEESGSSTEVQTFSGYIRAHRSIRDTNVHNSLRGDLIDHLWNTFGEQFKENQKKKSKKS